MILLWTILSQRFSKTDHAAISLTFGEIGAGLMNVSVQDDEKYLKSLRANIPEWKSHGKNELSDKRLVWD